MRTRLEKPEQKEEAEALALALLDEATALFTIRNRWNEPVVRLIIAHWWQLHCMLPWREATAITDALGAMKMYAPVWTEIE